MVFLDYKTVPFNSSSDNLLLYTTEYKCMVILELTRYQTFLSGFNVILRNTTIDYTDNKGDVIRLFRASDTTIGSCIIEGNKQIRLRVVGSDAAIGVLHIYRIPESP